MYSFPRTKEGKGVTVIFFLLYPRNIFLRMIASLFQREQNLFLFL